MYLTRQKCAKNILQNEVASDFVFILKMGKNPRNVGSQNDRDRPDSNLWEHFSCNMINLANTVRTPSQRLAAAIFQKKVSTSLQSSALPGFKKLKTRLTIGMASQPVSRLCSKMILHSLYYTNIIVKGFCTFFTDIGKSLQSSINSIGNTVWKYHNTSRNTQNLNVYLNLRKSISRIYWKFLRNWRHQNQLGTTTSPHLLKKKELKKLLLLFSIS